MKARCQAPKAFTLVDLLVIITIIALVLAIWSPVSSRAKQQTMAAVCLSNQKALAMAWTVYADDNNRRLIGGNASGPATGGYNYSSWPGSESTWCLEPTRTESSPEQPIRAITDTVTLEQRFYGIRLGKLYPYIKRVEPYHCPADPSIQKAQPLDMYRSYSITGTMNGEDDPDHHPSQAKKAYVKMGEIKKPAAKMVFIEEYSPEQSWLHGSWVMHLYNPDYYTFWDIPAIWHDRKSTLSFADGHVEMVQWQDERTIELATLSWSEASAKKAEYSYKNPDLDFLYQALGGIPK